jgi:hypothetical protein
VTPSPRAETSLPTTGDLALAYAAAAAVATAASWIMLQAVEAAVRTDVRGTIEPLLWFTRIGVLASPVGVAVRVATHVGLVWATLAALGERVPVRALALPLLVLAPILEVPAVLDALSFLLRDVATFPAAHVPIGLDFLFPGHPGRLGRLLIAVNAATLAWASALALTLHRALGRSRSASALAAGLGASSVILLPLLAA